MIHDNDLKVRFATKDDIPAIVDIFLKNYNKSYIYEAYIDLDLLPTIFDSKNLMTLVAEYKGKVIGHIALVSLYNRYEIGRFLVAPGYKDLGVGQRLYKKLCHHIHEQKIHNVFTECVTTNGRSSNIAFKNGLRSIGLGLGLCKNFYEENATRETMQYMILPEPKVYDNFVVHSHASIHDFLGIIYTYHKIDRTHVYDMKELKTPETTYDISVDERNKRITIFTDKIGSDFESVIDRLCQRYETDAFASINVEIDLRAHEGTFAIKALNDRHFQFSFLWPNYHSKNKVTDLLCMQSLTPYNNYCLKTADITNPFTMYLADAMQAGTVSH